MDGTSHDHSHDHSHGHHHGPDDVGARRQEQAGHHFNPDHLLAQEARWQQLGDPRTLLRPLLGGDERVVVDVGAGVGRLALALSELLPDARVLAVDHQEDMVRLTQSRLDEAGRANARAVVGSAEHLPLGDGEADAVLMSVMLHDTADPARVLREARRVLRPRGRLVVIEFRPGGLDGGPPREILFTPEALAALLREAGFAPEPPLDGPGPLYRVVARPGAA